ncbi:peptide ABC transporter substrate-binding protein [Candidatus Azambacteria bacterium]|nr:peptide ABC transporter substrate-binding protein [Candidatus Azambacteria bacterium]
MVITALIVCAIGFAFAWRLAVYFERTVAVPAYGGTYTEALVGEPKFINPILAGINDADRDIVALVYSGLMRYDPEGNLVPDLAERYDISGDGKEYTFYLRKNVQWHDGKTFTADDVLFTISAITNPEYGSPLRASWQGVSAQKVDEDAVKIILPKPYSQFLERTTVGIIPKHIWEEVAPVNANLADANLKPIGTGPYRFSKFTKDKLGNMVSYSLVAHDRFWDGTPYIKTVTFSFFAYEDEALHAYKNGEVMGLANITPARKTEAEKRGSVIYALHIPKYFAVFFNQSRAKPLTDKNVRKAFEAATHKEEIMSEVFSGNGTITDSPLLPWMTGYQPIAAQNESLQERASSILEDAGWKDKNGDGVLEKTIGSDKEPTPLEITLVTSDSPDLIRIGELLKTQWEQVGARIHLENYDTDELKRRVIKPRKYDALLFGEALTLYPDPYLFWHSSQKKDPGLNLSLYDNKEVDRLLENIRESLDPKERENSLKKLQEIMADEVPAVFLFSPSFLYAMDKDVKQVSATTVNVPARRFAGMEKWYIATKRIEKTAQ